MPNNMPKNQPSSEPPLSDEERQALESKFEAFIKRLIDEQKATGKIPMDVTEEENQTWNDYWKHIGKVDR